MKITHGLYAIILCALLTPTGVTAQTAIWEMKPTDYTDISYINHNLFKAVKGSEVFLIKPNGEIIAQGKALTPYYEGKALLTSTDSKGEWVVGCLKEDGTFQPFKEKYYTLNGQNFYSDGLLTVRNATDFPAYIDEKEVEVISSYGELTNIRPFTESYAVVFKDKQYHLIDKNGFPVEFKFPKKCTLLGGTNVYKGEVWLYDTEGQFYTYNVKSKEVCKEVADPQNYVRDYLYRFTAFTSCTKQVPFQTKAYNGSKGLTSTFNNYGAYGYMREGNTVIPVQFSSATTFEDNLAIVKQNGKLGIIRYIPQDSFATTSSKSSYDFLSGESVTCSFNLQTPNRWKDKGVTVSLKDDKGNTVTHAQNSGTYSFTTQPTKTEQKTYDLTIEGEGLILHKAKITYSFVKITRCATCGKITDECEYKGYHPVAQPTQSVETPPVQTASDAQKNKPNKQKAEKKKNNKPQTTKKEKRCPVCKKTIRNCPWGGVH